MSVQCQFRIGVTVIHGFVSEVLRVVWETQQPIILEMPKTSDDREEFIDDFHKKWQFPHCWEALDAKQVVMEAMP